jgi:MFS family permease
LVLLNSEATDSIPAPRSWYTVILLSSLLAFSFIDRYFLVLLIAPITRELGISDIKMGWLLGGGFAIAYSLAGLPLAQMVDRRTRKTLVFGGVLLWSALTFISGYAHSFAALCVCRAGVAVGEAVLTPSAMSMIGDMFPSGRRALPTSVFATTGSVMGKGSALIGALVLSLSAMLAVHLQYAPWRLALMMVAVPTILIAFVFFFSVREPSRRTKSTDTTANHTLTHSFSDFLRGRWHFLTMLCIASGALAVATASFLTWIPTLLIRAYGMPPSKAGTFFGVAGLLGGFCGSLFWPRLALGFIGRRRHTIGVPTSMMSSIVLSLPFVLLMISKHSLWLLVTGLVGMSFCLASTAVMPLVATQEFAFGYVRGRLTAVFLLTQSLFGYTLGPLAVPILAAQRPGDPFALGFGVFIVITVVILVAVFSLGYCRQLLSRDPGLVLRD